MHAREILAQCNAIGNIVRLIPNKKMKEQQEVLLLKQRIRLEKYLGAKVVYEKSEIHKTNDG